MVLSVEVDQRFLARHKCPEILFWLCGIKSSGYESHPFVHLRNHNVDGGYEPRLVWAGSSAWLRPRKMMPVRTSALHAETVNVWPQGREFKSPPAHQR